MKNRKFSLKAYRIPYLLLAILSTSIFFEWSCSKSSDVTPPAPTVTTISPTSGPVGAAVTITGTNFSTTSANNIVTFNDISATVKAATATSLAVIVPTGATTGTVTVTVNSKMASGPTFSILIPPTISTLSSTSGPVGMTVTITGANFSATTSDNTVKFNGAVATVTAATATQLTVTVPSGATTGTVAVTVNELTAISSVFTVLSPTVTSISPTFGPVGTVVTVTGTGFDPDLSRTLIGLSSGSLPPSSATPTQLTFTILENSGTVTSSIYLSVNGAPYINGPTFTIIPTITNASTSFASVGTSITLTGTGFDPILTNNAVILNGGNIVTASVTAISNTGNSLTFNVPPGTLGATYALVISVNGQPVTATFSFTIAAFSITSISPTNGPIGTLVTITGTGFDPTITNDWFTVGSLDNGVIFVSSATSTQIELTVQAGFTTGPIFLQVDNSPYLQGPVFTVTP